SFGRSAQEPVNDGRRSATTEQPTRARLRACVRAGCPVDIVFDALCFRFPAPMLLNSGMWKILALRLGSFHPAQQGFTPNQLAAAKCDEWKWRRVFHLAREQILNVRLGALQDSGGFGDGKNLRVIRGKCC